MTDFSVHPVYLSARAAIVAPERAVPMALYSLQKWLPRLGPERWSLIMLLRGLSIDAPRRSDGTKRITYSWRELAEMLDVHEETVASWLKHKPIPNDKPWRKIVATDEKSKYLSLFIPRLRYAYETHNGKTRRTGFIIEILMEDPVAPEDEARLQKQMEFLQIQQGELKLETYRISENVKEEKVDLPEISSSQVIPENLDLREVNPKKPDLSNKVNPVQLGLQDAVVNRNFSDLRGNVKQENSDLQGNVNQENSDLTLCKSEFSGKNVFKLESLIQQLKYSNLTKPSLKNALKPIVQLTEQLLEDKHSTAMFNKVLKALYPERLDLYISAVRTALQAAEDNPDVKRGAVFVRSLKDFAEVAGVDLGLKRKRNKSDPVSKPIDTSQEQKEAEDSLSVPSEEEAVWSEAQSILQRQMTRATYDRIIQGTKLIGQVEGIYVIGVQTEMAKEWLENRLRNIIKRALSNVLGEPVKVEFKLMSA